MTEPLAPPPRKDPRRRTRVPTLPPAARSRAALGLTAAAAEGRFALQVCAECGAVAWPPRDACAGCLSVQLVWRELPPGGEVLAETAIHASPDPYFRERLPWRVGTVRLDAGPSVIAHLHGDVARGARVRMAARLDRAGQGVLIALPEKDTPHMEDDPALRALTCHPRHRRVLLVDGRDAAAPAMARALRAAGAAAVWAGEAEGWRGNPARAALAEAGAAVVPLDITDSDSVARLAGEYGGRIDIVVFNARHLRPGGVMAGNGIYAREAFDVHALGLMRLARALGPAMAARAADGVNAAAAWVNILSVWALIPDPAFGAFAAAQAAALSVARSLRGDFRASGIRVMNLFAGPIDDEWHQPLPPPKLAAEALARELVRGLAEGAEEVWCGDVARDIRERWARDPKVLEREMTGGGR